MVAMLAVFAPAIWLVPDRYGAYAAGVQAAGVLLALIFAYVTLSSQNRAAAESLRSQVELDRVSRTLGFHEAMVSGEIQGARIRLIDHLRSLGVAQAPLGVSLETLRRSEYSSPESHSREWGESYRHTPFHDVSIVLRFFERAEPALKLGLVDEALLHRLLGRHIAWWDETIDRDEGEAVRYALSGLADWVWEFIQQHPDRSAYVANWVKNLARDFPNSKYAGLH
ncbi:MAG TPA: hypothetical protein VLL08_15065 [Kineosporiaceae bacterium]|nr:hypothetical protein [Kineosporiaceae bacterium]